MAASMRLRLHFDGNVCTQLSPRKCLFLVNLDSCNVVADLEYLIRERFQLDRGLNIYLYLDDFLLPSMEKIHVVRDNDTLWVKLTEIEDHLLQRFDASPTTSSEPNTNDEILFEPERQQVKGSKIKTKKRKSSLESLETSRRKQKSRKLDSSLDRETGGGDGPGVQTGRKKTKSKEKRKEKTDLPGERRENPRQHRDVSSDVAKTSTPLKSETACSRDQRKKSLEEPPKQKSPATSTTPKSRRKSKKRSKATAERKSDNLQKAKQGERASEGSNSSKKHNGSVKDQDGEKQGKVSKIPGVVSNGPAPKITAAISPGVSQDGICKASAAQCSSEGSRTLGEKKLTPVCLTAGHIRFESDSESGSDSSSENLDQANQEPDKNVQNKEQINSEIASGKLVENSQPATELLFTENRTTAESGHAPSERDLPEVTPPPFGQIPNEGQLQKNSSPSPRGAFSARGRGFAKGNRGNRDKKRQVAASQSNESVIIQNGPVEPAPPPKDFTSFPLLVGPPRQGDVIAYKILELSESYCPELSEFKEAKVLSVDVPSGQIEVDLQSVAGVTKPSKPGKFDLQWEDQDTCSDETDPSLTVSLQLQDLVDPRLVPSKSA